MSRLGIFLALAALLAVGASAADRLLQQFGNGQYRDYEAYYGRKYHPSPEKHHAPPPKKHAPVCELPVGKKSGWDDAKPRYCEPAVCKACAGQKDGYKCPKIDYYVFVSSKYCFLACVIVEEKIEVEVKKIVKKPFTITKVVFEDVTVSEVKFEPLEVKVLDPKPKEFTEYKIETRPGEVTVFKQEQAETLVWEPVKREVTHTVIEKICDKIKVPSTNKKGSYEEKEVCHDIEKPVKEVKTFEIPKKVVKTTRVPVHQPAELRVAVPFTVVHDVPGTTTIVVDDPKIVPVTHKRPVVVEENITVDEQAVSKDTVTRYVQKCCLCGKGADTPTTFINTGGDPKPADRGGPVHAGGGGGPVHAGGGGGGGRGYAGGHDGGHDGGHVVVEDARYGR